MQLDARAKLFLIITATFVTALIVGDLVGGRLTAFSVFGLDFTVSVGMIPFPIVFVLTDLLNEFYGKKVARFVTLVGAMMAAFTILVIVIAGQIPWAPITTESWWTGFDAASWDRVFASSTRILIASVGAYLVSQLLDIFVFHFLKRVTHNKLLWLRATGSTVASQLIDTVLINFLAFGGKMPASMIAKQIAFAYVIKLVVAIAMTPVIYAGHALVEKGLELEPIVLGPDGEPILDPRRR